VRRTPTLATRFVLAHGIKPANAEQFIGNPQVLAHPWVTEDMPQGLGDLNDDILLSSPRTAARRGVMASLARRDAAFGTGPGQGGFSVGQTEVRPRQLCSCFVDAVGLRCMLQKRSPALFGCPLHRLQT
jgi:hypothetical protein